MLCYVQSGRCVLECCMGTEPSILSVQGKCPRCAWINEIGGVGEADAKADASMLSERVVHVTCDHCGHTDRLHVFWEKYRRAAREQQREERVKAKLDRRVQRNRERRDAARRAAEARSASPPPQPVPSQSTQSNTTQSQSTQSQSAQGQLTQGPPIPSQPAQYQPVPDNVGDPVLRELRAIRDLLQPVSFVARVVIISWIVVLALGGCVLVVSAFGFVLTALSCR